MSVKRSFSLRTKLLLASIVVEAVMLTLLVTNSLRLTQESLVNQTRQRSEELNILFNGALGAPLAQRDYATLNEFLEDVRRDQGVVYMVLKDRSGQIVASAGWEANRVLPVPSHSLEVNKERDDRFDLAVPIKLAGQTYGTLSYGLSSKFLHDAQSHLLQQSLLIAAIEIFLSFVLLAGLGFWLTRHLGILTRATEAVAMGDFNMVLPVKSADEIGQLTQTFNLMSETIRGRIAALTENEAKFHAIADFTYGWESWIDPNGQLIWSNPSVERITGYTPQECMEMTNFPVNLVAESDAENVLHSFKMALQGGEGKNFEFQLRCKDGSIIWVVVFWQSIYGANRENKGIRASMLDISGRKQAELALVDALADLRRADEGRRLYLLSTEEERARLVALLGAMNMGILFVNADSKVKYYNPAFMRIWMISEETTLAGKSAEDVLKHSGNILARPDNFSKHVLSALEAHEVSDSFEIVMADGRVITQLSYPVRDNEGRFIGRLWIYEDVTRERQTAEQLIYLAERDSLTGLFNRRRFQDELSRLLADSDRHESHGALLFFDLDEFKYVNDTFGHRAGDAMLIRVAGEVGALVRRNEILSRLGGDEFALLMPDATEKEAETLAERIVRAISQIPFRFEGQNLRLTTSLGIAHYPKHAVAAEELVAHADAAMYQAKESGKNAWRSYRPDLDDSREMVSRLSWNDRIGRAFENNLLRLHFQGVYLTDTGELSHLEVLVRMVDEQDESRLVMPGHFIPFAEKSGKILDIDRWVLRESIKLLSKSASIPSLAVNISGRSFDEPTLPHYIAEQLSIFNVRSSRLWVELTETSAISDLQDAERFIEALRQTGCHTCLDDFGTGFSSFAYLKHLKADVLKIDGLFIRDLPNDRDNQVFVKSIVDVARGLGKKTVAEFVENAETLEMLKRLGVDMVQGYHLDKPRGDHPAILAGMP
ncbi:EAL domain-containing protein [Sulfurirhabdus autotrophica]|nr:EAL domain-containing protein [Sulfurirhabdus autotrophica]